MSTTCAFLPVPRFSPFASSIVNSWPCTTPWSESSPVPGTLSVPRASASPSRPSVSKSALKARIMPAKRSPRIPNAMKGRRFSPAASGGDVGVDVCREKLAVVRRVVGGSNPGRRSSFAYIGPAQRLGTIPQRCLRDAPGRAINDCGAHGTQKESRSSAGCHSRSQVAGGVGLERAGFRCFLSGIAGAYVLN